MSEPVFNHTAVINDRAKVYLRELTIRGISTAHDSTDTDHGVLYGNLTKSGGTYTLDLYNGRSKMSDSKVLTGSTTTLQSYFYLADARRGGPVEPGALQSNYYDVSGRAWLETYAEDDTRLIAVPTFAVDLHVKQKPDAAAALPGYDADYGLAYLHAQATGQIWSMNLPAMLPHLFDRDGLADFVPDGSTGGLPPITSLASIEQLRSPQVHLVNALAYEQAEHVEQFAKMAVSARKRFDAAMKELQAGNLAETDAEEEETEEESVSVGTWIRG